MAKAGFWALLVVLPMSGCGTASNLDGGSRNAYGGVLLDAQVFRDVSATFIPWPSYRIKTAERPNGEDIALLVGLAADMPLSAIADTVTLPVILYARLKEASQSSATAVEIAPPPVHASPP